MILKKTVLQEIIQWQRNSCATGTLYDHYIHWRKSARQKGGATFSHVRHYEKKIPFIYINEKENKIHAANNEIP